MVSGLTRSPSPGFYAAVFVSISMLINFPYIKRDTPIHRLDPRAKFVLMFAYSFSAAQTSNFWIILAGLTGAAIYYSLARLKWRETKRVWIFIIIINSVIIFSNFLLSGGAVVQGVDLSNQHILFYIPFIGLVPHFPFIGPVLLPLSVQSIFFIMTQAMRNFGIALLVVPIPYTTNPGHLGIAFKGLGIPDRFAYAIDLSFRFLPSVARDFGTTLDAQRARGFEIDKIRGGILSKIARLAPMVVPVVIGSIVEAEDIINAMELRCFGVGKRTWFTKLHARPLDRVIIALSIIGFFTITLFNILGNIFPQSLFHVIHTQGIPPFLLQ